MCKQSQSDNLKGTNVYYLEMKIICKFIQNPLKSFNNVFFEFFNIRTCLGVLKKGRVLVGGTGPLLINREIFDTFR